MPPILSSGSLTSTCASSIASTVTNALCDFSSDVSGRTRTATVMFSPRARRSVSAEPPPSAGGRRPGLVERFGIFAGRPQSRGCRASRRGGL